MDTFDFYCKFIKWIFKFAGQKAKPVEQTKLKINFEFICLNIIV